MERASVFLFHIDGPRDRGQAVMFILHLSIAAFLLYRKLRKSPKMVYNGLEMKNGIAKERRDDFAMTLSM